MSKFLPTVRFETEFQGDTVTMDLKSLSRKDFFGWMPYFDKVDDEGNLPESDAMELVNEAADLLPDYVSNFSGLKDANGNAVTLDQVMSEVYFLELVTDIVMKLIEISQVQKPKAGEDERDSELGKSAGPRAV